MNGQMFTGQLDPLGYAFGAGLAQGAGNFFEGFQSRRDMDAFTEWAGQVQNSAGQIDPTTGEPIIGQAAPPMPRMRSAFGQQLQREFMLNTLKSKLPLSPLENAQISLMGAQAQRDIAEANAIGKPRPMTAADLARQKTAEAQAKYYEEKANSLKSPKAAPMNDLQTSQAELNRARAGQITDPAMTPLQKAQELYYRAKAKFLESPKSPYNKPPWYMDPESKLYNTDEAARLRQKAGSTAGGANIAGQLRSEFMGGKVKQNYDIIVNSERQIRSAYEMSASADTKSRVASDQALAVTFQKILDPGSVVRESEYARTPEGVAIINQLQAWLPKLATGGLGITNDDRKAILDMASSLVDASKVGMNEYIGQYETYADEYKVPRRLVLGNYTKFDTGNNSAVPVTPAGQGVEALSNEDLLKLLGAQ